MTRKKITIILLVILTLGALSFGGYKIADSISKKKAEEEGAMKAAIAENYIRQNKAFFDIGLEGKYRPYEKRYEWILQTHIIYYIKKTGKTITLEDVETFLATSENPDGTRRTWVDDETGIIKDFVTWYNDWHADELDDYKKDIDHIFTQYIRKYPNCPYNTLYDLTPEQIIELDKKYEDPDYELMLKW